MRVCVSGFSHRFSSNGSISVLSETTFGFVFITPEAIPHRRTAPILVSNTPPSSPLDKCSHISTAFFASHLPSYRPCKRRLVSSTAGRTPAVTAARMDWVMIRRPVMFFSCFVKRADTSRKQVYKLVPRDYTHSIKLWCRCLPVPGEGCTPRVWVSTEASTVSLNLNPRARAAFRRCQR